MKQLKLIMAVVAAFVCFNFVFAGKPQKETTENLATILVDKLGKDVQLTDSQRVSIKNATINYITNMEGADSISATDMRMKSKEQVSIQYESVLDTLLTTNQKTQRKIKIKDREKGKNK